MKRFINLGHQINNDKSERPQFAFYCTVKEGFEEVNEEYTWETIEDFKQDFLLDIERIYEDVQEYIDLIPETFGKDCNPKSNAPLILNLKEACDYMEMHPDFIKLMVRKNAIKHHQKGELIYFERTDLDAFVGQFRIRNSKY